MRVGRGGEPSGAMPAGLSEYRNPVRAKLEARWATQPAELAEMHDRIARASERVASLREAQWGALGVWWFRFTLRRALRNVDARARHDGSFKSLARAVRRRERALGEGRAVIAWLEQALAPKDSERETETAPARALRPEPTRAETWTGDALAVVGAVVRNTWSMAWPVLVVLGLVLTVVALVGGDGDVDPPDGDFHLPEAKEWAVTHDEQRVADVRTGAWTLGVVAILAVGGALVGWWIGT